MSCMYHTCVSTEPLPKCEHVILSLSMLHHRDSPKYRETVRYHITLYYNVCGLRGPNEYLHCVAMDNWIHRDSGNCNLDNIVHTP